MIRTIIFALVLVVFTSIGAIGTIIIGLFQRPSPISYFYILQPWSRLLLWVAGARLTVKGRENIAPDRSYVVLSNHTSHMDIPALVAALPIHLTIIAKKELFRIPIFAQGMRGFGILEIDRSNRQRAIETLRKAAELARSKKISILAFPEGTRSTDGKLKSFKKGPFMMALDAGMPILPVSVSGTFPILPKGRWRINPGQQVRVIIHPPIDTTAYTIETRDALIEKTHELIASGFVEYETKSSQSHHR